MENLCKTQGKSTPITCGLAIVGCKKSEIKHCLDVNKIGGEKCASSLPTVLRIWLPCCNVNTTRILQPLAVVLFPKHWKMCVARTVVLTTAPVGKGGRHMETFSSHH